MATVNKTGTGVYCNKNAVRFVIQGYSVAAVATGTPILHFVFPCDGRIIGIDAWAGTTGTVGGTTTIDIMQATGATSTTFATTYTTTANRPVINNLTTTGSFVTAALPDTRLFLKGDVLRIDPIVSANTGPALVSVTIAIGMP